MIYTNTSSFAGVFNRYDFSNNTYNLIPTRLQLYDTSFSGFIQHIHLFDHVNQIPTPFTHPNFKLISTQGLELDDFRDVSALTPNNMKLRELRYGITRDIFRLNPNIQSFDISYEQFAIKTVIGNETVHVIRNGYHIDTENTDVVIDASGFIRGLHYAFLDTPGHSIRIGTKRNFIRIIRNIDDTFSIYNQSGTTPIAVSLNISTTTIFQYTESAGVPIITPVSTINASSIGIDNTYLIFGYGIFIGNQRLRILVDDDVQLISYGNFSYGGLMLHSIYPFVKNNFHNIIGNDRAFCAIRKETTYDNSNIKIISWGNPYFGGSFKNINSITDNDGITKIYDASFTNVDGNIETASDINTTSLESYSDTTSTIEIYKTRFAFTGLSTVNNGSVFSWGIDEYGGDHTSINENKNIIAVYSNTFTFLGLQETFKNNTYSQTFISWGHRIPQNTDDVSYKDSSISGLNTILNGDIVKEVYHTDRAFLIHTLKDQIYAIGDASFGGYMPKMIFDTLNSKTNTIVKIESNYNSFAVIYKKNDSNNNNHLVLWGNVDVSDIEYNFVDVEDIAINNNSYLLLKTNGSLMSWSAFKQRNIQYGGIIPYRFIFDLTNNVDYITSNKSAFAIIKDNQSIFSWGQFMDSNQSIAELKVQAPKDIIRYKIHTYQIGVESPDQTNIITVSGETIHGFNTLRHQDVSNVDFVSIYTTNNAFAARDACNNTIFWGDLMYPFIHP